MSGRDLTMERVVIKDRYEVLKKLGHGATGSVYLAWDRDLQREVAVKVLHQDLVANEEINQRFDVETLITSRLQHPGVVAVFDRSVTAGGAHCYIMSLALGKTLSEFLDELRASERPWQVSSLVDRINVFIKILDVITYAHGQGVVHRDLKPENIILGEHGEVRVLDWGLARVLRDPETPLLGDEVYDEVFDGDGSSSDDPTNQRRRSHDSDRFVDTERVVAEGSSDQDATIISAALEAQAAAREDAFAETDPEALPAGGSSFDGLSATVISDPSQRSASESMNAETTDTTRVSQASIHDERVTHITQRHDRRKSEHRSSGRHSTASSRRHSAVYSSQNERSTRLGAVLGSPAYMSPEQAAGHASRADERTDVYSLGAILFELLTLTVPVQRAANEAIVQYIKRVEAGDRVCLADIWPESPQQLQIITEWALARDVQDRYASCEIFREELRILLVQFSENFAERERLRLANERKAAWLPIGSWNYQSHPQLDPFTEPVLSFAGEPVGQVVHPEMEGVLLGGVGVQVYPVAREVADDIHVRAQFSISRGEEGIVFVRGVPPQPCYAISIGAFGGRWITVSRLEANKGKQRPILLSMQPLRARINEDDHQRHGLDIQVIGSSISVEIDDFTKIAVRDPCPLAGPLHRQMAFGSQSSQIVIHQLSIDQRRSPLMIPSAMIGNELLRQQLIPQAIDVYRRFLQEHAGTEEAVEAHFMLCLAFRQAGQKRQSERELEMFLSQSIDHPLAQDAIFELARLKVESEQSVEKAVRTVLSYQEADDRSRSRFCLWMIDRLCGQIAEKGLTSEMERDIGLLQHLISVFEDSELLMDTLAQALSRPITEYGRKLMDRGDYTELDELGDAVQRCRLRGFDIQTTGLHPLDWYRPLVKRMLELPRNHPEFVGRVGRLLGNATDLQDVLSLVVLGAREPMLRWMESMEEQCSPPIRLLRGAVAHQLGRDDISHRDFMACFQMMDVLETERTSSETTVTARLAFFALEYLPWEVVWQPIERMADGDAYRALSAVVAEQLSKPLESASAYRSLLTVGSGFVEFGRNGLERLGLAEMPD